jgi:hypothetical protein
MTLFAYRFPLDLVYRIMDVILAEGAEAVLRFALALVRIDMNLLFVRLKEMPKRFVLWTLNRFWNTLKMVTTFSKSGFLIF